MIVFLIFVIGLCIGSFLNCLVYRLHEKKSINGRSLCPQCKKIIAWYDNIPVISFIMLRGKCRHCKQKIFWQYPVVELVVGLLFVLVWYNSLLITDNLQLTTVRNLLFVSVLVVIFIYDLRWYLILDVVTLPAILVAVVVNLYLGISWISLFFATVIGGGFFLLQFAVSKGKWIGGGDIRLGVLMGAMLGYPGIIVSLMVAYISGSIVGIGLLASRQKQWSSQLPFGTFLSIATMITLLYGNIILDWYLGLIY